jgi:hypothetical protein
VVSLSHGRPALSLLDHDTNGSTVPLPPRWLWECIRDIADVIGFALIHGFPLIVSVIYLVCQLAEPRYVFV